MTLMELNALNCDEKPALLPINSTQSALNARFGKGSIKFNELTCNILTICVLCHISVEKYRIMKRGFWIYDFGSLLSGKGCIGEKETGSKKLPVCC